jgi:hypothetical protein
LIGGGRRGYVLIIENVTVGGIVFKIRVGRGRGGRIVRIEFLSGRRLKFRSRCFVQDVRIVSSRAGTIELISDAVLIRFHLALLAPNAIIAASTIHLRRDTTLLVVAQVEFPIPNARVAASRIQVARSIRSVRCAGLWSTCGRGRRTSRIAAAA